MPKYFYKAKNLRGEEESGILAAEDTSHLAQVLRKKGFFLIEAREEGESEERGIKLPKLSILSRFFRVPLTEKLFFTRNLEVMIKSGVSLPRSLEILAIQAKTPKFKMALEKISKEIVKGRSLADALGEFPDIFPTLYQETVRVGEETGKIEDALKILSVQMEREHSLKSRIKAAMIYPMIVLCLAFSIGIFMMIFAVPKLKAAFEELGVELPFTTQLIISFADFLRKKWPLAILLFVILIFAALLVSRIKKTGKFKSKLILSIPIISKLSKQTNSALALRTLSSLLSAGVPIVRALEVGAGALTNFYFQESLKEAAKVVEKGKKLSEALQPYQNLYSPMVLQMMKVGEETGETARVLEKLADFYEEEIRNATQKLSSIIEPLLIIFIGGVVGFFAVSMMQPMFGIMSGIR